MARVKAPLFSLEAGGTVAKTVVFSQWKGRPYARIHVVPLNPNTAKQVNVRTAMDLIVAAWALVSAPDKLLWDSAGLQFQWSGFNLFVSRGMKAYVDQLGTSATPASVSCVGVYASDVWTWA